MCQSSTWQFWPDSISLREKLGNQAAFTHQMVTDLYLLALAVAQRGKLATLDRTIPAAIVAGGPGALEVID